MSVIYIYIHGDLCVRPNRRVDSPREVSEAERLGWMRGPRDQRSKSRAMKKSRSQKSLKISSYFSLSLSLAICAVGNAKTRGGDLISFRNYMTRAVLKA